MKKLILRIINSIKVRISTRVQKYKIKKHILLECKTAPDYYKNEIYAYLKSFKNLYFLINLYFPYAWTKEYDYKKIIILRDEDGYPYVVRNGNKLFFQKDWNNLRCQQYYNSLLIEQDYRSPHVYFNDSERCPNLEDTIVDVGAAEGVFAFDILSSLQTAMNSALTRLEGGQFTGMIYLFECDSHWEIPLKKTFAPWKDKCIFINKYVGDKVTDDMTTLDDFFHDKKIDYIKADIEGMEDKLLIGGKDVLTLKCKKILLCLYHLAHAESIIKSYLKKYNFIYSINPGYMIFYEYDNMPPYLRHGVIFGQKA